MKTQSINPISFKAHKNENKKTTAPLAKAMALAVLMSTGTSCVNNSYMNRDTFEKAQKELFCDDTLNTQIPFLLKSTLMNVNDFKIKKIDNYNYTVSLKDDDLKADIKLQPSRTDKTAARGTMKINEHSDYDFKLKFDNDKKEMFIAIKENETNKSDSFFVQRKDDALRIYNAKHKQILKIPVSEKENELKDKTIVWDTSTALLLLVALIVCAGIDYRL